MSPSTSPSFLGSIDAGLRPKILSSSVDSLLSTQESIPDPSSPLGAICVPRRLRSRARSLQLAAASPICAVPSAARGVCCSCYGTDRGPSFAQHFGYHNSKHLPVPHVPHRAGCPKTPNPKPHEPHGPYSLGCPSKWHHTCPCQGAHPSLEHIGRGVGGHSVPLTTKAIGQSVTERRSARR